MSFKGLFAGLLISVLAIACGDSSAAQGESCVSTDSRSDCDPGLLCASSASNQNNLTCQKECSMLGDAGVGCADGETCTKTTTGSGTYTCRGK